MRKIAVIGMVLLTAATFGCSKKSQEGASDSQTAPAPAAQQAAPAAPAPAPVQEAAPAAPAQGMDMGKPAQPGSAPGGDNKAAPQDGAKPN